MKIELREITIRELVEGYQDNAENGVVGFWGKLDIRPPYQREFIYKDKQRDAVITTAMKDFPLNVMYWAVKEDGNYEVIDGQQRTISLCQYVTGVFSHMMRYFHNLTSDEKETFLDYTLMVYLCSGTESEKLEWFRTINIAGEKLTEQELRNAVYTGSWVTDAKRYFSKNGCPAYSIWSKYLNGSAIRQEYLETAISWISKWNIEVYMSKHQHDANANELWLYFQNVMNWLEVVFSNYRKEMKGVPWGELYNEFRDENFDGKKLEEEIVKLMQDEDVTNKKWIYSFILTRKEKFLNIRTFSDKQKREAYERQKGTCANTKNCMEKWRELELSEMEADHITPWHEGGKTTSENCQMLCRMCNRTKSGK